MYTKKALIMMKAIFLLFTSYLLSFSDASSNSNKIGVNYGRVGNNLPSPYQSIKLIQSMKAGLVKLYDADPEILKLLSNTNIHVSIMICNEQISNVASNDSQADLWVHENILAYLPGTKIRFVLVGNEVFSSNNQMMWHDLIQAMRRIKRALHANNIHNIKVGTPLAMDSLESTFPPSSAKFRPDIPIELITALMNFLNSTNSFFFLDVYTYFPWSVSPAKLSLDFALLNNGSNETYVDPKTGLVYTNLLDQMLDSVHFAMQRLGFGNVSIAIAETGWPHDGDIDQPGANAYNAATYVTNLVAKMTHNPPLGTPARPGVDILTFLFSLYDENQKPGPGTERHWGLTDNNGAPNYQVDLTGMRPEQDDAQPAEPVSKQPYRGKIWCVVAGPAPSPVELGRALDFVCGQGNGTICDELAPGKSCYEPISAVAHASYAFSSYWAQFRSAGQTCYFNGLAVQTTTDPSHGSCKFPSVSV